MKWKSGIRTIGFLGAVLLACNVVARDDYKPDLMISKYAGILATNRLADDRNDVIGRTLLKVAGAVNPNNETVLLTEGYLERDRQPRKIPTKVTEEVLARNIGRRADQLLEIGRKKNRKVLPLSMAYFLAIEKLLPGNPRVILGIMKARALGVPTELATLTARPFDLQDIFENPAAPERTNTKLVSTEDEKLAAAAAALGINRLARRPGDATGTAFVHFAAHLDPNSDNALLALGYRMRGAKPQPVKAPLTEDQLVARLLTRAGALAEDANRAMRQKALLFYLIAEKVQPTNDKVIIAIARLDKHGVSGDLDSMLGKTARSPDARPATITMRNLSAVYLIVDPKGPVQSWSRVPDFLKGAAIYSRSATGGVEGGVADWEVKTTGVIYLACNWDIAGFADGEWKRECTTAARIQEQGWTEVKGQTLKQNNGKTYKLYRRVCRAEERFRLRCNKYTPPLVILPRPKLPVVKTPAPRKTDPLPFGDDDDDEDIAVEPPEEEKEEKPATVKLTEDDLRRIDINVDTNKKVVKRTGTDSYYYYRTYNMIELKVEACVDNRTDHELKGCSIELFVVTRDPRNRNRLRLESRDTFDLTLPAKKESKEVSVRRVVHQKNSKDGYGYYGWLAILRGPKGTFIKCEATSRSDLDEIARKLEKMRADTIFTREGQVISGPSAFD